MFTKMDDTTEFHYGFDAPGEGWIEFIDDDLEFGDTLIAMVDWDTSAGCIDRVTVDAFGRTYDVTDDVCGYIDPSAFAEAAAGFLEYEGGR